VRAIKVIFWNSLVFIFCIAAIEIIFGGWFSKSISTLYIPCNKMWTYEHNLYPNKEPVIYNRDRFCLRGDYQSPKNIDILTVGGSTTDQRYLSDDQTWQQFLKEGLSQTLPNISVVNAGVDGQTTFGHLWNFAEWFPHIPEFSPKIILFYVGINDSLILEKLHKYDDKTNNDIFDQTKQYIEGNSALYHLYRIIKGLVLARHGRAGHEKIEWAEETLTKQPLLTDYSPYQETFHALQTRIDKLAQETRKIGALPVFVTQKHFTYWEESGTSVGLAKTYQLKDGTLINGLDYKAIDVMIADSILEACQRTKAVCVDLARDVDFNFKDFYDSAHNTPVGAQKIGRYLVKTLENREPLRAILFQK